MADETKSAKRRDLLDDDFNKGIAKLEAWVQKVDSRLDALEKRLEDIQRQARNDKP